MGTSRSSSGSPSNVPLVPPWVPPVPDDTVSPDVLPVVPETPEERPFEPVERPEADSPPDGNTPDPPPAKPPVTPSRGPPPVQLAPQGRFRGARTSLGRFGSSGSAKSMRRGVGNYVRTGLGGTRSAAARFGGTARTASRLYGVLGGAGLGTDRDAGLDRALFEGRSARDVIDAIVEAAQPVDGTQDAEAGRRSISDALSELMTRFPGADLFNLSEEQRQFVIERFVAMDVW